MRVYTVHMPPEAAAGEAAPLLLAEGFSWPAFLFGPFWLAARRLWLPALAWLVLALLAAWLSPWLALGLALLLGFEAQDLHRRALGRAGWREQGVVAAPDAARATQRLVDAAA